MTFLKRIGVVYEKGAGFWRKNESQLEYIFRDMCQRVRTLKIQLHPQNGGSQEEFSNLVEQFEKAKRAFYRNGIHNPSHALETLRTKEDKRIADRSVMRVHSRRRRMEKTCQGTQLPAKS